MQLQKALTSISRVDDGLPRINTNGSPGEFSLHMGKRREDGNIMIKEISSENAPAAVGPYSAAVESDGCSRTVFVSGQLPIDPATGEFAGKDVQTQTKQSIENIRAILAEAGLGLGDVVKTTVLLADINDFGKMNEIYGEYFHAPYPARCAFQVAALPKGALVEIEATAAK